MLEAIEWDRCGGLIPAVVQDAATMQVLMVGQMTPAALSRTLETGLVTFHSRQQNRLWTKGEHSGHVLHVVQIIPDQDRESVLIQVRPEGPTSSLGVTSYFGHEQAPGLGFLALLETVIEERKSGDPAASYTARLMQRGVLKVAQKVGEEGVEVALAAVAEPERLTEEAADLLFHLMMALNISGRTLSDVVEVLRNRHRPNPLE